MQSSYWKLEDQYDIDDLLKDYDDDGDDKKEDKKEETTATADKKDDQDDDDDDDSDDDEEWLSLNSLNSRFWELASKI